MASMEIIAEVDVSRDRDRAIEFFLDESFRSMINFACTYSDGQKFFFPFFFKFERVELSFLKLKDFLSKKLLSY